MGGYNTLVEALSAATPTVCVPRVAPRSEQLIRARAFAGLGLVRVVEPARLSASVLRQEVTSALDASSLSGQFAEAGLDLGGARRAAEFLIELAERPSAASAARASA
jgi:predicted glycosyltransferase